jgi:hypothetical protein
MRIPRTTRRYDRARHSLGRQATSTSFTVASWAATRPVIARLVKGAESIIHESVCLGVHLPRHPADADAREQSDETARNFVQLTEMFLSHSPSRSEPR